MRYRLASLFSGAGGLDLGFKQTGAYDIVFANDISVPACMSYSANFGLKLERQLDQKVEATVNRIYACDVAFVDFSPLRGEVDVVVGGPPCQDFSIVRGPEWDRRGIHVRRGRLYMHFIRALATIQPLAFVFENVPGLVSANRGAAYKTILEDLSKLNIRWSEIKQSAGFQNTDGIKGYEIVFSGVVDFSALGVPQRRSRLIIVGVRKDLVRSLLHKWSAEQAIRKALSGGDRLFRKYPLTPLEVFEGDTLPNLADKYEEVMKQWEGVWREVGSERAAWWKENVWDRLTFDVVKDYILIHGAPDASGEELDQAFRDHEEILREMEYYQKPVCTVDPPDETAALPKDAAEVVERMRMIPPDENHEFVRGTKWEVEGKGISLVYRRIHPLKPSYTIVAYGGGGTHGYHYERERATLTLREKARLQTFPDSFIFKGGRTAVRAQIGEAVPPLAGKRIAEALLVILSGIKG